MENNVLSLIHIYNIITADKEKEESICNQDLPLQTNVLNASILSACLEMFFLFSRRIFKYMKYF